MQLTTAQQATLKADIAADPTLAAQPNTPDGCDAIAQAYARLAAPDYWVFRTNVPVSQIGDAINAAELVGLTAVNLQRLQCLCGDLSGGEINPAIKDRRDAFDQVFSASGGTITRPALAVLWRRKANRVEKLFAAASTGGTGQRGATTNPDTMTLEGTLAWADVLAARNS